jgi:Protein of unknown function (DUF3027)
VNSSRNVANDVGHATACHERWRARRNRTQDASEYKNDWYQEQCGACRFFVPLTGILGSDYGACTNEASPCDKIAMFEHDGCEQFERSGDWDE